MNWGVPTHKCHCGCEQFKVWVSFEDYEISAYSLEMYCLDCGDQYVTPTPLDKEVL